MGTAPTIVHDTRILIHEVSRVADLNPPERAGWRSKAGADDGETLQSNRSIHERDCVDIIQDGLSTINAWAPWPEDDPESIIKQKLDLNR